MPKYKVTFQPANVTVEADPECYPYGKHGQAGGLLDISLAHGVQLEHACGGSGVCGTCRVEVVSGMENLTPADEDELDTIDKWPGSTLNSRLACQAVVKGDVAVRVPAESRQRQSQGGSSPYGR